MIFQLMKGTSFDVEKYGLTRLFHHIPSAEIAHSTSSVDGRSDMITNSKLNNRTISVEFLYQAYDIYDYYLLRDQLNALFARAEPFYIIFKREPYRRWKVRLANGFKIPPHPSMQAFTIDFITENVYAESIATTADLKQWDIDKWGWNNAITWDDDLQYRFTSSSFVVKNLSDETIDPREHELEIVLKGTFASTVKITNQTTGEVYQYNRALAASDELRIKGVRTLRNGTSDFKSTNKKLIRLFPGNNNISVEGGTVASVAFNFRFLFK